MVIFLQFLLLLLCRCHFTTMSYRKAIEAEIGRYEVLAGRLENNLKNVTQSLVADRNFYKAESEEKEKQLLELRTQNVELKAINGCLRGYQKSFEKMVGNTSHDQSLVSKWIMEAATMYSAKHVESEAGSAHQTPQPVNSSLPKDAANEVVTVEDEDEHNGDNQE